MDIQKKEGNRMENKVRKCKDCGCILNSYTQYEGGYADYCCECEDYHRYTGNL